MPCSRPRRRTGTSPASSPHSILWSMLDVNQTPSGSQAKSLRPFQTQHDLSCTCRWVQQLHPTIEYLSNLLHLWMVFTNSNQQILHSKPLRLYQLFTIARLGHDDIQYMWLSYVLISCLDLTVIPPEDIGTGVFWLWNVIRGPVTQPKDRLIPKDLCKQLKTNTKNQLETSSCSPLRSSSHLL